MLWLLLACATVPDPVPLSVTAATVPVPSEADALAHGRRLVHEVAVCAECHGDDLGGQVLAKGFPIGRLVAPNLTLLPPSYAAEDWVRAIRHGATPDGRALLLMPVDDYVPFTVGDLGAMVAYLESLEPVGESQPTLKLGPIGRMLVKKGEWVYHGLDVDHDAPIPTTADARGAYLAEVAGCMGCHADGVGKSFGPGMPRSANITPHATDGIGGWSLEDFRAALTEGRRPDGRELAGPMPWKAYADWPDDDVQALYEHLMSQPPRATPKR